MAYETILTRRDGGALLITLNRPKVKNAISTVSMDEIREAAQGAESDDKVRAVVITGGPDYFAAGADLNDALAIDTTRERIGYFDRWHKLCFALETLEKPVIAAIEGFCITGGLEMALACDMRFAGEGSSFAITSAKIGTVPGAGGTQRLPRIIGPARAMEMLMRADPIDAAEAERIGLINRKVAKGGALAHVMEMIEIFAERGPLSLRLIKRAVQNGMQMDMKSAIDYETFLVTTIYGSDDRKEGISAFLDKRQASFKGD
ncbi:MAG: enoyl-CoA hydratase/isomerase family protein [Alphaproteobacteria bacterium]